MSGLVADLIILALTAFLLWNGHKINQAQRRRDAWVRHVNRHIRKHH